MSRKDSRLDAFLVPAHATKPQLGAPLVVWRIERIYKGRADRTASEQGFRASARSAVRSQSHRKAARDRKRDGRVHEIMRHKLQQIGVTGGDAGIFPALGRCVGVVRQCSSASIAATSGFISARTFGKCAGASSGSIP